MTPGGENYRITGSGRVQPRADDDGVEQGADRALVALLVVEGEMAHVEGVAEEVTAGTARNRRPLV